MNDHQRWVSQPLRADEGQVTMATLAELLPSSVDLQSLVSTNGSLTDEDIQRLIIENPLLLSSRSSNFDPVTQVQQSIVVILLTRYINPIILTGFGYIEAIILCLYVYLYGGP